MSDAVEDKQKYEFLMRYAPVIARCQGQYGK